jgi:hypothetical protein
VINFENGYNDPDGEATSDLVMWREHNKCPPEVLELVNTIDESRNARISGGF